MDVALTIIVGFGGAIVGAVAGFLGAVHIERQQTERTRVGMLRALASELQQNAAATIGVLYSGRLTATDFDNSTWRDVRFELAQFVEHRLYEDLAFVYLGLPGIERLAEGTLGNLSDSPTQDLVDKWLADLKDVRVRLIGLPQMRKFAGAFKRDWESTASDPGIPRGNEQNRSE